MSSPMTKAIATFGSLALLLLLWRDTSSGSLDTSSCSSSLSGSEGGLWLSPLACGGGQPLLESDFRLVGAKLYWAMLELLVGVMLPGW